MPHHQRYFGKNLAIKDLLEYRKEQHEQYLEKKREEQNENTVALELANTNPFNLEDNVMLVIFSFLPGEQILNVISRVCFSWFRITNAPNISNPLWEQVFKRRFTFPLSYSFPTTTNSQFNNNNNNNNNNGGSFQNPNFWKDEFIARAKCRNNWKHNSYSTIYFQGKPSRKKPLARRTQYKDVKVIPTSLRLNGTHVYVGNTDGTLAVYSTITEMKERTVFTRINTPVKDIYIQDNRVYLSFVNTPQIAVISTRKWKCMGVIGNGGMFEDVWSMAISLDRRYLAASYTSGDATLWDLRDGSVAINLPVEDEMNHIAIYGDDLIRCSVSKAVVFNLPLITQFRERLKNDPGLADETPDEENPLLGYSFELRRSMDLFSLCIDGQERVMLAVASENKIRIYDTDGSIRFSFKHKNFIIGFIADKRGLISLSNDGVLKAWDLQRGEPAFKLSLILMDSYHSPQLYLFGEMIFVKEVERLSVYDRFTGDYITTITLPLDVSYIDADDARLLVATSSGCILLHDYGEGIMNWQGLSGGRRLGGE